MTRNSEVELLTSANKANHPFGNSWIDWRFKDFVTVKDLRLYLWRLAELANEMSNERDDQLWDKVQKQQGAMPNQYLMGQKLDRLMTVSANVKDELGIAMKETKDSWTNF